MSLKISEDSQKESLPDFPKVCNYILNVSENEEAIYKLIRIP